MYYTVPDLINAISCYQRLSYQATNANIYSYKSAFCPPTGYFCQFNSNPSTSTCGGTSNCDLDYSCIQSKYLFSTNCALNRTCCRTVVTN